jgi:hypothetical protein
MTWVEALLVALVALLVAMRLFLWVRGGVEPGSAALSPAQRADGFRIEVAAALHGRRALVPVPGGDAVPGVVARVHEAPVQVRVRLLGREELDAGAAQPGDATPDGQAPARLEPWAAELVIRVGHEGGLPALLWSRTGDPRAPDAADAGPAAKLGDAALDAWIELRTPEAERVVAALRDEDLRDLCRRLLLVNAPFGARLRVDAQGLEWASLVTHRTTPEWVSRAAPVLLRLGWALTAEAAARSA